MKSIVSFAPLEPDAVQFLIERTGIDYSWCDFAAPQWLNVTARDGDGAILGVFVGEFQTWFEVHITCAIDHPRFLTRRLLHAIFGTLFTQAVRLTALTRPDNEDGIRILKHLGFRYEGFLRMGIEGRWDGLIFGMLRNECRWLGKTPPHLPQRSRSDGQVAQAA
jgi:hypothetical protein